MKNTSDRIYLASDYQEGAHPAILEAFVRTNMEKTEGYGSDPYCEEARALIRNACSAPDAAVHFFLGGTQVNAVTVTCLLKPWQGVIAAEQAALTGADIQTELDALQAALVK